MNTLMGPSGSNPLPAPKRSTLPQETATNLPLARLQRSEAPPGHAYIANLSGESLTLTALLPGDSVPNRNLLLSILDTGPPEVFFPFQDRNRERTLQPGEVAQLTLARLPSSNHVSLFRVRKEGHALSYFLKYTVPPDGNSAIQYVGPHPASGQPESTHPHLLYVW